MATVLSSPETAAAEALGVARTLNDILNAWLPELSGPTLAVEQIRSCHDALARRLIALDAARLASEIA